MVQAIDRIIGIKQILAYLEINGSTIWRFLTRTLITRGMRRVRY